MAERFEQVRGVGRRRRRTRGATRVLTRGVGVEEPDAERAGIDADLGRERAVRASAPRAAPTTRGAPVTSRIAAVSRTVRDDDVLADEEVGDLVEVGADRDAAARRLEPDEPAARRRDADRAAAVVGVGDGDHPARHRRRRTTARTAGACGRASTGCASARRTRARWSAAARPPACWCVRRTTNPASRKRAGELRRCASRGGRRRAGSACPRRGSRPRSPRSRSLSRNGTPRKGPSGSVAGRLGAGPVEAVADHGVELRVQPPRSASMAASTSSAGETSPVRTSSACPTASIVVHGPATSGRARARADRRRVVLTTRAGRRATSRRRPRRRPPPCARGTRPSGRRARARPGCGHPRAPARPDGS